MTTSHVSPEKLSYEGVSIERPCLWCNTVDLHWEGRCNAGYCAHADCVQTDKMWTSKRDHDLDLRNEHSFVAHSYEPCVILDPPVAFDAIIGTVKEIGLPTAYTSDLFRDYQRLVDADAPKKFIWAVRTTGTDLIEPHHSKELAKIKVHANQYLYVWDQTYLPGLGLNRISADDALMLFASWKEAEAREALAASSSVEVHIVLLSIGDSPSGTILGAYVDKEQALNRAKQVSGKYQRAWVESRILIGGRELRK